MKTQGEERDTLGTLYGRNEIGTCAETEDVYSGREKL